MEPLTDGDLEWWSGGREGRLITTPGVSPVQALREGGCLSTPPDISPIPSMEHAWLAPFNP